MAEPGPVLPTLDADEARVMAEIDRAYGDILAWGLVGNVGELAAAVHVLQGFVIQHMLQRLAPAAWGRWDRLTPELPVPDSPSLVHLRFVDEAARWVPHEWPGGYLSVDLGRFWRSNLCVVDNSEEFCTVACLPRDKASLGLVVPYRLVRRDRQVSGEGHLAECAG